MNDVVKAALTFRQAQVAEALLDGLTNREIAERLGISRSLVQRHLQVMFYRFQIAAPDGRFYASGKRIVLARQLMCA